MNAITLERLVLPYSYRPHPFDHHNHHHPPHLWSRRQFVRAALTTLAAGAAFSSGFMKPGLAFAGQGSSVPPLPIPGGTPALGGIFHVFGPGPPGVGFDPIDTEPITITDFNGFVGLAYISGTVTQTNTATGEIQTLPFLESDMRFMKGVYKGTDGQIHQGAFALV
jgi:hypothetical protein